MTPDSPPGEPADRTGRRDAATPVVTVVVLVLITAWYYAEPVEHRQASDWVVPVGFAVGLVALAWVLLRFVRRAQTVGGKVGQVLALAYLTIIFFAHTYFVVESASPGEFADLRNRTDALYLSVTIVTTVGFGDVHAAGEGARGLVIVHMLFNLFVLGVAVAQIRGLWQPRS